MGGSVDRARKERSEQPRERRDEDGADIKAYVSKESSSNASKCPMTRWRSLGVRNGKGNCTTQDPGCPAPSLAISLTGILS